MKAQEASEFRYCVLPSGNREDFPALDAELARRGVRWSFLELRPGGRIYRIPDSELEKLPWDEEHQERYLGDDDSGHTIYRLSEPEIRSLAAELPKIEWQEGGRR